MANVPNQKIEEPAIETYAAAKTYLEIACAELVGRKVSATGTIPNVVIKTMPNTGEEALTVINIGAYASEPVLKVSSFTFLEPSNVKYFAVAVRALCAIAFEKKCRILEFTDLKLPYVKGLLPFGAVPLTVPTMLEASMDAIMKLPMVSRHLGIDEYTRLSLMHKRAYHQPHMAWIDLFMAQFTEPYEDPAKITFDKSESFKRRMNVGTSITMALALNHTASLVASLGKIPTFEPVAPKENDSHYLASQLPAYHPPRLFLALDYK